MAYFNSRLLRDGKGRLIPEWTAIGEKNHDWWRKVCENAASENRRLDESRALATSPVSGKSGLGLNAEGFAETRAPAK